MVDTHLIRMLSVVDMRLNDRNKQHKFHKLLLHKECCCIRCGCTEIRDLRLVDSMDHSIEVKLLGKMIKKWSIEKIISTASYDVVCVNCIRNLNP